MAFGAFVDEDLDMEMEAAASAEMAAELEASARGHGPGAGQVWRQDVTYKTKTYGTCQLTASD